MEYNAYERNTEVLSPKEHDLALESLKTLAQEITKSTGEEKINKAGDYFRTYRKIRDSYDILYEVYMNRG